MGRNCCTETKISMVASSPVVENDRKQQQSGETGPDLANEQGKTNEPQNTFDCNICLSQVTKPIVTDCGHLFCWPCIYEWMQFPSGNSCPVCKADISKDKMTPIYGHDMLHKDPREDIPQRPNKETSQSNNERRRSFDNVGVNVSFGVDMFPFTGFHSSFQFQTRNRNNEQSRTGRVISKILQWGTIIFIFYTVFA